MRLGMGVAMAVAVLLGSAGAVRADIVNGGFESMLDGWTVTDGPYSHVMADTAPPPYEGSYVAALDAHADGAGQSGHAWLKQTVTAVAGNVLSFQYQYSAWGNYFGMPDPDHPMDPWGMGDAGVNAWLWKTGDPYVTDVFFIFYSGNSGGNWVSASYVFVADGTYDLNFEAWAVSSGPAGMATAMLFVDNVTLTPEPATMSLLGLGLVGMVWWRKRR